MKTFVKQHPWAIGLGAAFALFMAYSFSPAAFAPGREIGNIFGGFFMHMIRILPCVFVLIGLFDVWVKRETVEKHLGHGSGLISYVWAILLAGTTVGGMHIALPVAHALHTKGARLGVVLTYVTCAGICRVPMTLFEASFLGWKFTLVRFAASLPLVVLSSALIGIWFERQKYRLPKAEGDRV